MQVNSFFDNFFLCFACADNNMCVAGSANWITSVGNERGEIVLSILTTSESKSTLQQMADGLMRRYAAASEPPPSLLYTDCDCCNFRGPSKYQDLFSQWPDLVVRLDIWHFMRRLAVGCTTESHPLYGPFMSSLSKCIFEWDTSDMALLFDAKKNEIHRSTGRMPTDIAVKKAIGKKELARHCRRQTRGAEATMAWIDSLLRSFHPATDCLGVPIFKQEMFEIWNEQRRHVECIQDPPNFSLYMLIGKIEKGGITLPVFRCCRGSTSLESFHLHLNRFIPGT